MKRLFLHALATLIAVSAFAMESPWDTKLPFKEATIQYELSGMEKGTRTIYVKDYGKVTAVYSKTEVSLFGMSQKTEEMVITDADWEYTIDLTTQTGMKQVNSTKYMNEEFYALSKADQKKVVENAQNMGLATLDAGGGTYEKNAEKILGYSCDKSELVGVVAYSIAGTEFPLKIEGNMMGIKIKEVATSIEKKSPPATKFVIPTSVRFEEDDQVDAMARSHAKTMIQAMLEGKFANPVGMEQGGSREEITPEEQEEMKKMMESMKSLFGGDK